MNYLSLLPAAIIAAPLMLHGIVFGAEQDLPGEDDYYPLVTVETPAHDEL